jgi:two-component sensor histidine kinase
MPIASTKALPAGGDIPAGAKAPRRLWRIRSLLLIFVTLVILPIWTFATILAVQFARAELNAIEASAAATARSIASTLEFRLRAMESAVQALALSPALRAGDLAAFHREAQAVARTQQGVIAIAARTGEQILNTNAPYGAALPPTAPEARLAEAAATRRAQISRAFFGDVTKRWLVSITLPLIEDDGVERLLVVGVDTERHFGEVLAVADLPESWAAGVLDDRHTIMARRPALAGAVGATADPSLLGAITAARRGSGEATSIDGRPMRLFFERLEAAGWTAVVGVPRERMDAVVREAVRPVLVSGLATLGLSLVVALILGRRFTAQLVGISRIAQAYRLGLAAPAGGGSAVAEIAELERSLEAAVAERARHEKAQAAAIAEKELLMQESHHRVKNSLQLVRGILSLQGRRVSSPEAREALEQAGSRILTVAAIHQHLYQGSSTTSGEVGRYLSDLVKDLRATLLSSGGGRAISLQAPSLVWPSEKLTALGLVTTELVTNAVKYGAGDISVSLSIDADGGGALVVEDQGPGFPEGHDLGGGEGLGSKLVSSLVRPPDGRIEIDRSVRHGRVVVKIGPGWRAEERRASA